ncbi:MAG TPA: glycosyltransferase family 2 protein [Actinomycetales bacterium]|nr:glycosyltransferase family 2 protein [Actinomycetales bacterium]
MSTARDLRPAVLVTDTTTPGQYLRCLRSVCATVSRDIEVIGVTRRRPSLPTSLKRRVRVVSPAQGRELSDAVSAVATEPRLVVVLRSDCRVHDDWFAQVRDAARAQPRRVGVAGGADAHLLVFPSAVRSSAAAQQPLPPMPGVGVPGGGREHGLTSGDGDGATVSIDAVLIVKDEESVLGECLAAVTPFVDRVVVYDTGSTDSTMTVARDAGAVVVSGYWDGSFASARNRALGHARGEWVFSLDADEVASGDPRALRAHLASTRDDVVQVVLSNSRWRGATEGRDYLLGRIFRRERSTWVGSLHEMLTSTDPERTLLLAPAAAPVRLEHSGYRMDVFGAKSKAARNLSIATTAVQSPDATSADWAGYGRSLMAAGRVAEGIEALDKVLDRVDHRAGPGRADCQVVVTAGRPVLESPQGLADELRAHRWLTAMEACGEAPGQVAVWEARLAMRSGDLDRARSALSIEDGGVDLWGMPFDLDAVIVARAELERWEGHAEQALTTLLELSERRADLVSFAGVVPVAEAAGWDLARLALVAPDELVTRSLREVFHLPPDVADGWLEALWQRSADASILVAASIVAVDRPFDRQLVWSLRARESGHGEFCPLNAVAQSDRCAPQARCLAAAVLLDVWRESDLRVVFDEALLATPEEDRAALVQQLQTYVPALYGELVSAVG